MSVDERLGRCRDDLEITPFEKAGGRAYRVVDRGRNLTWDLWELEHTVLSLMDGQRSAVDVAEASRARGFPVSPEHVRSFHKEMKGMGFVVAAVAVADHRSDAQRFVEEAASYMASGRYELAESLYEAALQIDGGDIDADVGLARCRKLMAAAARPAAATAPAAAGAEEFPVEVDVADVADVPEAPPPTSPTATTTPTPEEAAPPRRARARPSLGNLVAHVVLLGAAIVVLGMVLLSVGLIHLPGAEEPTTTTTTPTPTPTPAPTPTPTLPTPTPPTPTPSGPVRAPVVEAAHPIKAAVTSTIAGKFKKSFVKPGSRVLQGQKLLLLVGATGDEAVALAPAAGAFVPAVALGKTVKKGDVVGNVVDAAVWRLTARFAATAPPPKESSGCLLLAAGTEVACSVVSVEGAVVVVVGVDAAAVPWLTADGFGVEQLGVQLQLSP